MLYKNMRNKTSTARGADYVHHFAVITTICTFVLLCSGGLVTSKGVGMAVPDWPTTYGYNMFLFPISRWVGGVFYEHSHRLIASGVGILTLLLTAWLLAIEKRFWVRLLGIFAFVGVALQGVLGGLRVTLNANFMGIFHGMVAQLFLSLLGILALVTSSWFISGKYHVFDGRILKWLAMGITTFIFFQLIIGASMRHAHAGLAITDFPTAYGQWWWPPTDPTSISEINRLRDVQGQVATSAMQIALQMIHRFLALAIALGVAGFAWASRKYLHLKWMANMWAFLITLQILLGAWTIWSNKAADIATTHMAIGALSFFLGVQVTFLLFFGSSCDKKIVVPAINTPFLNNHHQQGLEKKKSCPQAVA